MTKEELIKRLIHLVEGHDTKDSLVLWWAHHSDELKTMLSSGQWLKLKPLNHGFDWVVVIGSQKGAMEILKSEGIEVKASSYYQEQYLKELEAFAIKEQDKHQDKGNLPLNLDPKVFNIYPKFARILMDIFTYHDELKAGASLASIKHQESILGIDLPPMIKEFFLNISTIKIGDGLSISLEDLYLLEINHISYCVLGEFWFQADGDLLLLKNKEETIYYYAHERNEVIRLSRDIKEFLSKTLAQY